ncbi:MAG: hypothetical protein MUO63_06515 [Desulfobulbaceae bacterium]|jgi:hypothetical protein|nr:hypothetical protein [Desulfobulbaceae bacterium]
MAADGCNTISSSLSDIPRRSLSTSFFRCIFEWLGQTPQRFIGHLPMPPACGMSVDKLVEWGREMCGKAPEEMFVFAPSLQFSSNALRTA